MGSRRRIQLVIVVVASGFLIAASSAGGKSYGGARVKVPNTIRVGERFIVKASQFPPNAKLVLRAVPYAQRGGNCCGVIISRSKRADQKGRRRFSVRFPFRYSACAGYKDCVRQPWRDGQRAEVTVESSPSGVTFASDSEIARLERG